MSDSLRDKLHRAKLKHYLNEEELLLPDVERERLLIQRELVDSGLLRDTDLGLNADEIGRAARKSAAERNEIGFAKFRKNWKTYLLVVVWLIASIAWSIYSDSDY